MLFVPHTVPVPVPTPCMSPTPAACLTPLPTYLCPVPATALPSCTACLPARPYIVRSPIPYPIPTLCRLYPTLGCLVPLPMPGSLPCQFSSLTLCLPHPHLPLPAFYYPLDVLCCVPVFWWFTCCLPPCTPPPSLIRCQYSHCTPCVPLALPLHAPTCLALALWEVTHYLHCLMPFICLAFLPCAFLFTLVPSLPSFCPLCIYLCPTRFPFCLGPLPSHT